MATLGLILVTAAWGLTFPLIKDAIHDVSPFAFVAIRFLAASLVMAAAGAVLGKRGDPGTARILTDEWKAGAWLGALLFLGYYFQTAGLRLTSASHAAFITGMAVVLVPLITTFTATTRAPRIRIQAWIGVGLSLVGLALLSLTGTSALNWGDALTLLCATAFAFQIVYVGKYAARFSPTRLAWMQVTVCGALSAVAALVFESGELGTLPARLHEPRFLGALAFCAIVATAIAYWAQNHFQRRASAVQAALIFALEPVFGASFAYLLIGETLGGEQLAGCALVLAGMIVSELRT